MSEESEGLTLEVRIAVVLQAAEDHGGPGMVEVRPRWAAPASGVLPVPVQQVEPQAQGIASTSPRLPLPIAGLLIRARRFAAPLAHCVRSRCATCRQFFSAVARPW